MIDAWYETYARELLLYIGRLTRGHPDTEDILSEVFLSAVRRPPKDIAPRAWLYQVARCRVIDWVRKSKRRLDAPLYDDDALMSGFEADIEARIDAATAWRATMTPRQFAAAWLYFVEGRDVGEIARRLNTTVHGSKALIHRARVHLAQ